MVLFLILAALPIAGAFIATGYSWGWDHLHRLGTIGALAFLAAGTACQLRPLARAADRLFDRAGAALERSPVRLPALVALLSLAAFALFPIATRIYGDSRYILDDYSRSNLAVHLKTMLSFGVLARGRASFVLHDVLARATGLTYEQSYMLVSVLCGGVFVFAFARLAGRLPGIAPWARAAILWLVLTDGANQLFFGHVENYTLPRLFGGLFLVSVLSRLLDPQTPRRAWAPILLFAIAVFFHSQALVLAPTLLLLLGGDRARRPALVAAGLAAVTLILGAAYIGARAACYDYIYSGGRPEARQLFLPVTTSCVGAPYLRYTLFSGAHLIDLAGSLFTISSGAILLAIATHLPRAARDSRVWVPAASIATAALHNFVLNTAIGFPFDWDLLCVLSLPLLATAIFLLARAGGGEGRRPPASRLLALGAVAIALFGVNANREAVYERVEDMGVWLHRTYYGGSHYRLSANLSTIADPRRQMEERARVLSRLAPQVYPDDREVAFLCEKLAMSAVAIQEYEEALEAYRMAVRIQPSRWDREKPLGYLETEVGDLAAGIRILGDYLERAPEDGEGWLFLGDALARAGRAVEARNAWTRFLSLAPDAPEAERVRRELERGP